MADFYRSVDDADAYFADQLFATDWTGAAEADKALALKMATRSVDALRYKWDKKAVYALKESVTSPTDAQLETASQSQPNQFPRGDDADPGTGVESFTVTITGSPTGGTFDLTLNSETASGIAYNADAATVLAALEGLASISSGDLTVTGDGPYVIAFVASSDHNKLTADGTNLTGGTSPEVTAVTTTDNIPDAIFWATCEEARELLAGRDPQQEFRNLELTSDGIGSTRVSYDRTGRPQHTLHHMVSPRAFQLLRPWLNPGNHSFDVKGV